MEYRLPKIEDEEILKEYIKEHELNQESSLSASHGLKGMEFSSWVETINNNATLGNEFGRSLCLLCFDNNKLVGLLSIRYELNEQFVKSIGHIGYGVRPSERNKGYATEMLKYALKVCKEKGLKQAVLGCYKDNISSRRTILKCKGILLEENDNYKKGRESLYFYINL